MDGRVGCFIIVVDPRDGRRAWLETNPRFLKKEDRNDYLVKKIDKFSQ
jgi:hypothetical protein